MKEYLVEWERYNKKSTTYDVGKFQEMIEAESELDAIELIKQYVFDNADKDECPGIEIVDDGVEFEEFEYCNFTATLIIGSGLISLAEYAELHGVKADTVRQKILRGNLKAKKIGRNWVIDKNEPYIDNRVKK